jgi:aminoglycoside phosphotransferase (APT) family kinase protein
MPRPAARITEGSSAARAAQQSLAWTAQITPGLAAKLVAAQFPQSAQLAVTTVDLNGWDNTTFRFGDDLSVRRPSAGAYVAQIDKEHR